jgi:gliding motility-associated-like protein
MASFLRQKSLLVFLCLLATFLSVKTSAQCGTSSFPEGGGPLTPTSTWSAPLSVGSGTYVDFNVVAGNFYSFRYTNPNQQYSNGNNMDMTLSSTSGVLTYNDNLTPLSNPWTGGVCPAVNPRPSSTEWLATYTGTVRINTKTFTTTCEDWVAGQNSALLQYKTCPVQADPGEGVNAWNVDAFATTDISLAGSAANARYGYYSASGINFNTASQWAVTASPSSAPGWSGCEVSTDKFTIRARRRGFTCSAYAINVVSADDAVRVYINGSQIYNANAPVSNVALGTYVLGANDLVEIRLVGLCDPENTNITFTPVASPALSAGSIGGFTNGANLCVGSNPGTFTDVTAASGGTSAQSNGGTLTYNWEYSSDNSTFTPTGVSTPTYNHGVLNTTGTFYVRRRVTDKCNTTTVSNTILVNVVALPNGGLSPANQSVCAGSQIVLTLNFNSGQAPFNVQVFNGAINESRNGKINGDTIMLNVPASPTTFTLSQIVDANSCSRTSGFLSGSIVTISPAINISGVNSTNVLCFGGNTGSITVTASGGTAPFEYSIDNGTTYQTSNVFNGLTAASYFVTVKDALGCVAVYSGNPVVISQPTQINFATVTQDASCAGVFDGTIGVSASGGVGSYQYSLNGGPLQPGANFSGLAANTYTVLVQDGNGCTATSTVTINNSYVVSTSIGNQTDVACFGGNDGTVTIQVAGGIQPYQYSINGGLTYQFSPTFSGLAGGNYLVKVIDAKGCPVIQSVDILEPTQLLTVLDSTVNAGCFGGTDAAIYTTTTGGTPGYTYTWSNGGATDDIVGVAAGNYHLTVVDTRGCRDSLSVTVTQAPEMFVVLAASTDVKCNAGADGTVDITVSGGTPPYSFNWSNGHLLEDLVNVVAGTYSVTVEDANGCVKTLTQVVNEPSSLTLALAGTNIICNGAKNGTVTSTVGGGVAPYTYFWSNGDTASSLTGVGGGLYTVIVTDANGCSISGTVTLTEPPVYSLALNVTNVLCFGDSTGTISTTAGGGTPPYTYLWNTGATDSVLTGVPVGFYSVTITDVNGCSSTASTTVTQPAELTINSSIFDVTCSGYANGLIDLTVSGGVLPYSYSWNGGDTTQDLTDIPGGIYDVTITDNNGCSATQSFSISEPAPISSTITHTDVTCNGAANGTASIAVVGGSAPYNYLWSNFGGAASVAGLSGNTYYVIVTDAKGCQHRDSVVIFEPAAIAISATVVQISCFGSADGVIDASVTGGTAGYSYNWSTSDTTQDLSGLGQGIYVLSVTDANGCTATASYEIVNPSPIIVNYFVKTPKCSGDMDGHIDAIPSGGVPPYTYAWSNGTFNEDLIGVGSGTYYLTITDTRNCSKVDTLLMGQPLPLYTTGFIKNVKCAGYEDGFLDITAYGGTLPYFFVWSKDSVVTEDLGNLSGGNYVVTVTDGNGCTVDATYFVYEPDSLKLTLAATNVTCPGAGTGEVSAVVTGGVYPYTYLWNTFNGDSTLANVPAGSYISIVTDFNGCSTRDSIYITEPLPFSVADSITNASCSGKTDGVIDLTVSGANGNYTYVWSTGATTEDVSGVAAGTYRVTITDALGCTYVGVYEVEEAKQLFADVAVVNPTCNGATTGIISVDVTGGDVPYTYTWSTTPVQTSNTASGLGAGVYSVTITDSKGCTLAETRTVTSPNPLVVDVNVTGSKCANIGSGIVVVNTTGGAAPFTYQLNGTTQASNTYTGLLPGTYVVFVRDANGCEGINSFTIPVPTTLTVDLVADKELILSGMEAQLTAEVVSDTTITRVYWSSMLGTFNFSGCADSTNCLTPTVAPDVTTTFVVTVMNADSCTATDTIRIEVKTQPSEFFPTAFSPNGDNLNDFFEFAILGVTTGHVQIFDRWGSLIYENAAQKNGFGFKDGWDGTFKGSQVQMDTYVYTVNLKYFNGVEKRVTGTIAVTR